MSEPDAGFSEKQSADTGTKGHRQRLRERFRKSGENSLADYELLEFLLFSALPRQDTKPIAKALLKRFGSFSAVLSAPRPRLKEIKGLSDNSIDTLHAIHAAIARFHTAELRERELLDSWSKVMDYLQARMAMSEVEQFRVLFLDKKNGLIADELQQTGTVDHTPVYPREVVRRALEHGGNGDHSCPQPSLRRPHALAGGYPNDAAIGRHRQTPWHRNPRSHHCWSQITGEFQGITTHIGLDPSG